MIMKGVLLLALIFMSFLGGYLSRKSSSAVPLASDKSKIEDSSKSESSEDRVIDRTISADGTTHEIIKEKIVGSEDRVTNTDKNTSIPVPSAVQKKPFSLLMGVELSRELMSQKKYDPSLVVGAGLDFNSTYGVQAQYNFEQKTYTVLAKKSF